MLKAAILGAGLFAAGIVQANADICANAWRTRNQIYKDAGYCFKTSRAIAAFGNAGCVHDAIHDVPLSPRQRREVQGLRDYERNMGCTD